MLEYARNIGWQFVSRDKAEALGLQPRRCHAGRGEILGVGIPGDLFMDPLEGDALGVQHFGDAGGVITK